MLEGRSNHLECLSKSSESTIHLLIADHDGWLDTDRFGIVERPCYHHPMSKERTRNLIADLRSAKMLSEKESLTADRLIDIIKLLSDLLKLCEEVGSFFSCLCRIVITEHDLDRSDSRSTREWVTTRRRRMDKWIWAHHTLPNLWSTTKSRYRHHSPTERLAECHDIRDD